jgi:AraC-like DNA-binding protein
VLPARTLGRLLRRSVEATGCRHIGVLIGRDASLSALGAVGFLMQSSPTVSAALQELERNLHFHDQAATLSLHAEGGYVVLGYRITTPEVEALDQIYAVAALIGSNFMRAMCGSGWQPYEVRLPFARPQDTRPLREALRAPLRFDAERLALVFPAADLKRPLATADPLLHRMMTERIGEIEAAARTGLVDRVRRLLRTLVFLPHCAPAVVAGRMGMSLRTLNRRLAAEQSSVRQLHEEVAMDAARQLLASTTKPASEIALLLGYSGASAFSRAFSRSAGMAPTQWRAMRSRGISPKQTAA